MKANISLVLVCALALAVAGCGRKDASGNYRDRALKGRITEILKDLDPKTAKAELFEISTNYHWKLSTEQYRLLDEACWGIRWAAEDIFYARESFKWDRTAAELGMESFDRARKLTEQDFYDEMARCRTNLTKLVQTL